MAVKRKLPTEGKTTKQSREKVGGKENTRNKCTTTQRTPFDKDKRDHGKAEDQEPENLERERFWSRDVEIPVVVHTP